MTVQELFQNTDIDDIVDAYMLTYGLHVDDYEFANDSLTDKVKYMRQERRDAKSLVRYIRNCNAVDTQRILFVYQSMNRDYEHKEQSEITSFYINDKLLLYHDRICIDDWQNYCYGYDFCTIPEIAGMEIATVVLEQLSNNTLPTDKYQLTVLDITTEVLNEITFFGYSIDTRQANIEKVVQQCDSAIQDVAERTKNGEQAGIPARKAMAELRESILNSFVNEDDRQYYLYQEEFRQQTKDITLKYTKSVMEDTDAKIQAMLLKESQNRWENAEDKTNKTED